MIGWGRWVERGVAFDDRQLLTLVNKLRRSQNQHRWIRPVDRWPNGVEQISGRPAFTGETIVEILGSVMKSEPDWAALPHDTPFIIRSLLQRCLQKDRSRRVHDMVDVPDRDRRSVKHAGHRINGGSFNQESRQKIRWVAGFVLVAIVGTALGVRRRRPLLPADGFDFFFHSADYQMGRQIRALADELDYRSTQREHS